MGTSKTKTDTIITTHENADFDAVASMLAAQKLYPGAKVVFPTSVEKSLRHFFVESTAYFFDRLDFDDIETDTLKRLVIVDTRQPSRLGRFTPLLDRPGLEIHIYDHHAAAPGDIKGDFEVIRPTGANVTGLIRLLRERNIVPSQDEATILCIGIYEDTGSFTFPSTTAEDFEAAGYLVSLNADLTVVSQLINREIRPQEVGLLNELLEGSDHHVVNGVNLTISRIVLEDYHKDFAAVVHKFVRMENLDVIFVIAQMGKKANVIARSRVPGVDVGDILSEMGGGGHPFAASAAISGKTVAQIRLELFDLLQRKVRSHRRAKDLMSMPVITVNPEASFRDAAALLRRFNLNSLIVTRRENGRERLMGYITRQVIEKGESFGMLDSRVEEYMVTDPDYVDPETDYPVIQEKIFEHDKRILPVVEAGSVRGVITRTDLLNVLVDRYAETGKRRSGRAMQEIPPRTRMIRNVMEERFPDRVLRLLREVGEVADTAGRRVFVVGGVVRDLLLNRRNEDLDIVVEGDGIDFARKLAEKRGGRIHAHEKFGTAVVVLPDGFKLDVASARQEFYRFPADLPTVEMSSIKRDLYRRDFTVNTLAVQLNPEHFGTLIDFFSARRDLKDRQIRILHSLSFVEDPSRIFRAVRFEQRFGFSIGKLTSGLIRKAVRMNLVDRLTGRRLFGELRLILEEENPLPALRRLQSYNVLSKIHPSMAITDTLSSLLDATKKVISWHDVQFMEENQRRWVVYLLSFTHGLDRETVAAILERLEIAPKDKALFLEQRFAADRSRNWLDRRPPVKNSTLYNRLSTFGIELLLYIMVTARKDDARKAVARYLSVLRYVKTEVTGKDLKKMGIPPGPIYREILTSVLHGRLNGRLQDRNDELIYVRNYISRRPQKESVTT